MPGTSDPIIFSEPEFDPVICCNKKETVKHVIVTDREEREELHVGGLIGIRSTTTANASCLFHLSDLPFSTFSSDAGIKLYRLF